MKKQTKAEKNKARYIELNTLDRPLTDKEEAESVEQISFEDLI